MRFKYISEFEVIDPDTNDFVPVEVWKDCTTGGVFGIDSTFLDQIGTHYNPFTGEKQELPEPDSC